MILKYGLVLRHSIENRYIANRQIHLFLGIVDLSAKHHDRALPCKGELFWLFNQLFRHEALDMWRALWGQNLGHRNYKTVRTNRPISWINHSAFCDRLRCKHHLLWKPINTLTLGVLTYSSRFQSHHTSSWVFAPNAVFKVQRITLSRNKRRLFVLSTTSSARSK